MVAHSTGETAEVQCYGSEQDSNPVLPRPGAYMEPICTPGAEGLSDLVAIRGEGGSILSTDSTGTWSFPKRVLPLPSSKS